MALNRAHFILVYIMTCYCCIFYRYRYGVNNVILSDILKPKDKELLEGTMYNIHLIIVEKEKEKEGETENEGGRYRVGQGELEDIMDIVVKELLTHKHSFSLSLFQSPPPAPSALYLC